MNLDFPRLVIDRKQNLSELTNNVCQEHKRFTAELKRALDAGIHVVILCEHGGKIETLNDVRGWVNPRLSDSPLAVSGERLHKILSTMKRTYDFEILFCKKADTGKEILRILSEAGK